MHIYFHISTNPNYSKGGMLLLLLVKTFIELHISFTTAIIVLPQRFALVDEIFLELSDLHSRGCVTVHLAVHSYFGVKDDYDLHISPLTFLKEVNSTGKSCALCFFVTYV